MKAWLFAATLAGLAAGCQDGPQIAHPTPPHQEGPIFEDIPSPPHFELDVKNSRANQNPGGHWRIATQILRGKGQRVAMAAEWYTKNLKQPWAAEGQKGDPMSDVTLSFSNKEERLTIHIKDESPSVVLVTVKVDKKS